MPATPSSGAFELKTARRMYGDGGWGTGGGISEGDDDEEGDEEEVVDENE